MSDSENKPIMSEEIALAIWDKAAVAEAYKIAQSKELGDEDKTFDLATQIITDAKLEAPVTEDGKTVRAFADTAMQEAKQGIPSPYMPKVQFDYNKYRDEHTGVALKQAFGIIAKHNIIAKMQETEEEKEAIFKAYNDCSLELFKLLNENKVGIQEYGFFFSCLSTVIKTLEAIVDEQVGGHRKEVLSRLLGAKNPGTDKFDSSYATYEDLISLMERTRKATGDKLGDYFDM